MNKNSERTQRYQDKAIKRVVVKLNKLTEPELVEWVEQQENVQGYIKSLIFKDMGVSK